jgi:hypothetical protein
MKKEIRINQKEIPIDFKEITNVNFVEINGEELIINFEVKE